MNLLRETEQELEQHEHTSDDVRWVGNAMGWFSWDVFAALANEEYDDGYGRTQVWQDLIVVGEDWWLERHEYDGSEWWEYKTQPQRPKHERVPLRLFRNYDQDNLFETSR